MFGRDEKGLKSSVIHGISNPSSGAVRLELRGHTRTHRLHRTDQGGSRKAWKRKEEISTNEDCTDDPKLQLLPSLAASQQFLQSPQMQFFTLVLCFPSPSPGLRIQCASVELHPQLQITFRHTYHPSTAHRPRQAPPAPTKGRRATGVQ